MGTRLLSHLARLKAQAVDVSLATHIFAHVAVEHSVAGVVGGTGGAEVGQQAPSHTHTT